MMPQLGRFVFSLTALACLGVSLRPLGAQSLAPNVSQVLMYSATTDQTVPIASGNPIVLSRAVPNVFTESSVPTVLGGGNFVSAITNAANFRVAQSIVQINSALNASIATALSVIPLASPASGVIVKTDAAGNSLPASSTLGSVFTERAETIGRHKVYLGFTHQDYHFTSMNGKSLNGMSLLYTGGDPSNITANGQTLKTLPTTFDLGMDVRLSQNIAILTYGVTDRFDISLGLPLVHAAVASRTFNGIIYAGDGLAGQTGTNCWCVDTFTPGSPSLTAPSIGQANRGKTGFGDTLLRFKATVLEGPRAAVAVGTDIRFATGDESNYLGSGTTSLKPFAAVSMYLRPLHNGVVIAPHFNVGWQFSGKSKLGGQLQGTNSSASLPDGSTFAYVSAPFTSTKDYLPDVFSWAVGAEVALGTRSTVIADILGNQLGWIHGIADTKTASVTGQYSPITPYPQQTVSGLISAGRTSYGQYSGAFGYKARIMGDLVFTLNALVRFDNNGLTARFAPLYGLGYTF
jgi:hypothetical protein